MTVLRENIVRCARSFIGTPWIHQARSPGIALDCLGVIGAVAERCQVEGWEAWNTDPILKCYGEQPRPDLLIKACKEYLDPIPISKAGPGDIFVMSFYLIPWHFGIVTEINPFRIVHAYKTANKVIEGTPEVSKARIFRAFKFRGVEPWPL